MPAVAQLAAGPSTDSSLLIRLRGVFPAVIGLIVFIVALEVLRLELRAVTWDALTADILATPGRQLALAVMLTIVSYVVLSGYDFLAFAYIGKKLPRGEIALISMLAYALTNSVGGLALTGVSVRYRFYTRRGLTGEELSRIVFSYSVTFWLGLFALGGLSLALGSFPSLQGLPSPAFIRGAGWVLMMCPIAYVIATSVRTNPIRIRTFELPVPSPRLAVAQIALSCVDWALAGSVLYVLLPPADLSFLGFLGAFLAATLLGLASHVPGGLGVFEGLMVLLLQPYMTSRELVPALIVFRAVYYVGPFTLALIALAIDEVRQRRSHVTRAGVVLGRLTEQLTPRVLSTLTFLAGLVLLLSGATPAVPARLALLGHLFPLGVIESSHFIASVAGAVLLIVSQGLSRRLDAAYYAAVSAILAGLVATLLRGIDYEEALLLTIVLAILWRARPAFNRRAAFFATRFSPEWVAAVVAGIGASIWLGLFTFQHVAYSNELWWQFELGADASRYLRASVGAAMVLLIFAVWRLVAPAPPEVRLADDTDLTNAAQVIAAQSSTLPFVAYVRDKALLFNDARTGFLMYGVHARTWVALGDPVGPLEIIPDLVRRFLEECDDFAGVPVFYQVAPAHLHVYADFGLTFVKLGEEAKVDLQAFSLAGGQAGKFRQVLRHLEKSAATFRVVEAARVPEVMAELREVSNDWLRVKTGAEKGFSVGVFDERYLARFPVAVIEQAGHIVAFANLWPGPSGDELSVDLMRHTGNAPKGVMDALFIHLFAWGQERGYRWFVLGMAPLSGFEYSAVASIWNRIGGFVYHHGEALYGFQGLRAYKEKFNPVWEPRYLAYPGGFGLPHILADISALIAGGYRRIILK